MQALGLGNNEDTYTSLLHAYSEKHRFYHTDKHINACLGHLDNIVSVAQRPNEIELALWFHDAIYKPFSKKNEIESAQWAKDFLLKNQASEELVSRVYRLIIVTLHNSPTNSLDESILVDIDLSILGSRPEVYDQFEKSIRKEYKWVPYFHYRKKRKEILSSFMDRDRIYQNQFFYDKCEKQARENLSNAILLL